MQLENIPCLPSMKSRIQESNIQQAVLAGGDDYELCFTAAQNQREIILALATKLDLRLTRIGSMNASGKLTVMFENQPVNITQLGYEHFA